MRQLLPLLQISLLLLLVSGCSMSIRETGFLADGYTDFNAINEDKIQLRVDPTLAQMADSRPLLAAGDRVTSSPAVFVISQPRWNVPGYLDDDEEAREDVLFTVRERFYRYLLRVYPHPVRARYALRADDFNIDGYRILTLETAVTDIHPGSPWLRYLVGYGAGSAEIQIEGRIIEHNGGDPRVVAEFVLREWHSGYAQSGMNTQVLRLDYCLRYAAEEAIARLTSRLPEFFPGVIYHPIEDTPIRMAHWE
ncbi:MAG: DUF4410 domain-containing protein [Candidatus Sumerlaeia bacterium]|nr:DUF4410 domain-containing protein [Candidatus Sumerlaeia bacterium]